MKTGYEVRGERSVMVTYTTKAKADNLVRKHPLLGLQVREVEITNMFWLMLKIIFY